MIPLPSTITASRNSQEVSAPRAYSRRRRRIVWWATAGFFLLQFGWLLVMPPATGIDEFDHLYRASAVSLGHWEPGDSDFPAILARGAMLPVRADIADASGPACAKLPYTKPFNCRPYRDLGNGRVEIASGVDYYNPTYYAVVGTLARPWTGNAAIYAMRVVSIMACSAMFGVAVFVTTAWARTHWPLLLLFASCLPTTVYSASIATPNGPQTISGILVSASIAALLRGGPVVRGPAYSALMVGAGVMANTHTLGLLWLGLSALSLATCQGISQTVRLLLPQNRRESLAMAGAAIAVAFQLWWFAYARPNVSRPEGGLSGSPWGQIVQGLILWPLQAIAAFPYRNEPAAGGVYGASLAILVGLVVLTVMALRGQRRLALGVGVTLALTVAVPIAITYAGFHQFGMAWQGRYGMPYAVGLFALAALALDSRPPMISAPYLWLATAGWGLAHTLGLLGVLTRQRGDHVLVGATGWWAPPPAVIILTGLLATAAWLWCVELARRPVAGAHQPTF